MRWYQTNCVQRGGREEDLKAIEKNFKKVKKTSKKVLTKRKKYDILSKLSLRQPRRKKRLKKIEKTSKKVLTN